MTDTVELYDTSVPDTLTIPFATNPKLKVTGPGYLSWGQRRRVTQLSDGSYDGMLDAIIKVWLTLPETSWNVAVKDPKSGSVVTLPRTEDVIDGMTHPSLKAEDVGHISLALGEKLYPGIFAAGLFEVAPEGNSEPPVESLEDSTEPVKMQTRKPKSDSKSSAAG